MRQASWALGIPRGGGLGLVRVVTNVAWGSTAPKSRSRMSHAAFELAEFATGNQEVRDRVRLAA